MRSRVIAALPLALALVWLSGCATMAGWVGVASEEAIQATEELQQLAEVMESRLEQMPRDAIQELVEILQRYLDASE